MARYTAELSYICSIYPGPVEPQRRSYGTTRESQGKTAVRSTLFKLEPVLRGEKPFVLEVCDSFEDILDLSQMGANGNTKARIPKPVPVESIVEDLLARWTGGIHDVPQGAKPGIGRINNSVPSKQELRELNEAQTAYFEFKFNEGERLHQEKKWGDITDVMRLASTWLDRKRVWAHANIAADSEPCPFCTEMVPNIALVCPKCTRTIRAIPADLLKLNPGMQAVA